MKITVELSSDAAAVFIAKAKDLELYKYPGDNKQPDVCALLEGIALGIEAGRLPLARKNADKGYYHMMVGL